MVESAAGQPLGGLLCRLLRIASPEDLHTHATRGPIFETWVVSETLKHRYNRGLPADLNFWRDIHGLEIDIMFEHANRLHAIECKSGTTYSADWLASARRWRQAAGPQAADPILVYGGDQSYRREDHRVLSWRQLGAVT